jgi:hypothetical protein
MPRPAVVPPAPPPAPLDRHVHRRRFVHGHLVTKALFVSTDGKIKVAAPLGPRRARFDQPAHLLPRGAPRAVPATPGLVTGACSRPHRTAPRSSGPTHPRRGDAPAPPDPGRLPPPPLPQVGGFKRCRALPPGASSLPDAEAFAGARWAPPEARRGWLERGTDAWLFGLCMWEVLTFSDPEEQCGGGGGDDDAVRRPPRP